MVLHGEKLEAHKRIAQEWWDNGFTERMAPETAPEFLTRTFPVPKKSPDFPWRGVGDFRPLNSQTKRLSQPLPIPEDILTKQGRNHIFSVLDMKQAFHQQPLRPDSRPLTCSHTPIGLFQWRVNVMGLMNAGIQFQSMMEDILEPVREVADPFIDDIIVGTQAEEGEDLIEKHLIDLRKTLNILQQQKIICKKEKCHFFCNEVEFCGSVLGYGKRCPAPGKLMAVQKWELPKTITEMRAFLGLTNQYEKYVPNYAQMVACLQDKLKVPRALGKKGSKHKIEYLPHEVVQFEELKQKLCEALSLNCVNPNKPFVLRVDASRYAVGATLEQLPDEGRMPTSDDAQNKKLYQ
jgi:putative transposase